MKKLFWGMAAILMSLSFSLAQSVSPSVQSVAGTQQSASNAQVSWTIGQTATTTLSSPDNQLTQGFQQSNLTVTSIGTVAEQLNLLVYPNPAHSHFQVRWEGAIPRLEFQLIDVRGKQIDQWQYAQGEANQYDVSRLPEGNYYLRIKSRTGFAEAFNLQVIR